MRKLVLAVISIFFVVLTLLLLPIIVGRVWNTAQAPIIKHKVIIQQTTLEALSEDILSGASAELPDWILSCTVNDSRDTIYFDVAGWGLVPSSIYYGFYYSKDRALLPYPGMEDYDRRIESNTVIYCQPDGDNGCLIEPIIDNFYFIKVWY